MQTKEISAEFRSISSHDALKLAEEKQLFVGCKKVSIYLSFKEEFDTLPFINFFWENNIECYVPILSPKEERLLDFVPYARNDELVANRYSILEPVKKDYQIAPEKLDLVFVPLLAFDQKGNRLGKGGGYYDKTFAFLKNTQIKKPTLIGLGFNCQEISNCPHDPWDLQLDGVLTEKGFRRLGLSEAKPNNDKPASLS